MPKPIYGSKTGPAFDALTKRSHGYEYRVVFNTVMADWQKLRRDGWELVQGTPARSQWRRPVQTGGAQRDNS